MKQEQDQVQSGTSFKGDEHWGKGGRYVLDVTNNRRVPLSELSKEQLEQLDPVPQADNEEFEQVDKPAVETNATATTVKSTKRNARA